MKRSINVLLAVVAMVGSLVLVGAAPANQSWIVVLERDTGSVPAVAAELARGHGGTVGFVYEHAVQGFSVTMPAPAAAALARNPRVAYVEADRTVTVQAQSVPTGIDRTFASGNSAIGIDGVDDARVDVDVAVIDTGIDLDHPDLHVVGGVTCSETGGGPPWSRTAECTSGGDDDHYHGTHVAGTIAALDDDQGVVGMAPGARLHAVKVLSSSGSGSEAMVVAGIDWVAANADTIEVANMSLGGAGHSQAEYDAIQGAVDAGVAFAVAAGNDDDDARNYSPAAFDNALTVSALADFDGDPGGNGAPTCRADQDDTLADFSNWGPAVDVAAPGVCILSTYPIEEGGYGTISGTSMASPHAAGALALLASAHDPTNATDVGRLYDIVTGSGNLDWVDDSGDGIKEPLLDVSSEAFAPVMVDGDGDGNQSPTATFTAVCTELACDLDATDSHDPDGSVVAWDWDLGDGATATGATVSHTYAANGTYEVVLTVTDDGGATATSTQSISVSDGSAAEISLSATAYKVRGRQHADLSWSGSTHVTVLRDGVAIATVESTSYTDNLDRTGGGSATYEVCDVGTGACSNGVTVTW